MINFFTEHSMQVLRVLSYFLFPPCVMSCQLKLNSIYSGSQECVIHNFADSEHEQLDKYKSVERQWSTCLGKEILITSCLITLQWATADV